MKNLLLLSSLVLATSGQAQTQPAIPSAPPPAISSPPPVAAPAAPGKRVTERLAPNRPSLVQPVARKAAAPELPREPAPSQLTKDMYQAFMRDNLELADLLIQQGADINCRNCNDLPLLWRAMYMASGAGVEPIRWVLAHGGNPNITLLNSPDQKTALMVYLENSMSPSLRRATHGAVIPSPLLAGMLDRGGDVHARTTAGETPLHFLSRGVDFYYTSLDMTLLHQFLIHLDQVLAKGADINARDSQGRTPLWQVVSHHCSVELVRAYRQRGADMNAKTEDGTSLRDVAYAKAVAGDTKCNAVLAELSASSAPAPARAPTAAAVPDQPDLAQAGLSGSWRGVLKLASPQVVTLGVAGTIDASGQVALRSESGLSSVGQVESVQEDTFSIRLRSRAGAGQTFLDGSTETPEFRVQGRLSAGVLRGQYQATYDAGEFVLCKDGAPAIAQCSVAAPQPSLANALSGLLEAFKGLAGPR